MNQNIYYETELILLVLFSVVVPAGIYGFLYSRISISRWTVMAFAMLLVGVAGIDVVLLQSISEHARVTASLTDNKAFWGQLSLTLYLVPAVFAGLGINVISHVLTNHLNEAERKFDQGRSLRGQNAMAPSARWLTTFERRSRTLSELQIVAACAIGAIVIFALDLISGDAIHLHVLYVFPLAVIALRCAELRWTLSAMVVTTTLQIITFAYEVVGLASFVSDIGVAFAASIMVIVMARKLRNGRYENVRRPVHNAHSTNLQLRVVAPATGVMKS